MDAHRSLLRGNPKHELYKRLAHRHWKTTGPADYHLTAVTLDMTACSSAEEVLYAMITGRIITKTSTLKWLKEELAKPIRA